MKMISNPNPNQSAARPIRNAHPNWRGSRREEALIIFLLTLQIQKHRKNQNQPPISNCPLHFARLHDYKGIHAIQEKKSRRMGGQFPSKISC
jgi:hypothetical protein